MTIEEAILSRVQKMPDSLRQEVLDFVEYLESRHAVQADHDDSMVSLSCAMRGMENENSPYSLDDLKEVFS